MRNKLTKSLAGGIVAASVLGFATLVSALPTLTISDGTSSLAFSNASGFVTTGLVSLDNWSVIITTGETKPLLGSASNPQMDVVIQASSIGAGTLSVALSDTDFTGVGSLLETITGHVVSGASETVGSSVYGNTGNVLGTLSPSGSQVNFGSPLATVPVQAMPILASAPGSFPGSSPYALTEYIIINTSDSSSTSVDASFAAVPEPSTCGLLFLALAGLGAIVRRKQAV
jgi:hypothetical protein